MAAPESARYVRACSLSDFPDSGILSVEINRDEVAFVRTRVSEGTAGEVFAIRDW